MRNSTGIFIPSSQAANITTPSAGTGTLNVMQQSLNQSINMAENDIQNATRLQREAYRAKIVADETKASTALQLRDNYLDIQDTILKGINSIAAIDEAKRVGEEKVLNKIYVDNQISNLNNKFLEFIPGAYEGTKTDGEGYANNIQNFLNAQIKDIISQAPNEEVKLQLLGSLNTFKLNAFAQGVEQEQKLRHQYKHSLIQDSLNKKINQVAMAPELADFTINSLEDNKKDLISLGISEVEANEQIKKTISATRESQIKSLLSAGDTESVFNILKSEDVQQQLDTPKYVQLVRETYSQARSTINGMKEQADMVNALELYNQNILLPGNQSYNKVADVHADNILFQGIPQSANFSLADIPNTAANISSYFKKYNKGIGKGTVSRIESVINSTNNPYEAVSYSMGLASIIKDPANMSYAVTSELDTNTKTQALRINRLVSAGLDPVQAVNIAREEMKLSQDPAAAKYINDQMSNAELENIGVASFLEDALDTWTVWFPDDSAAQLQGEVENLYKSNLLKYKNPDLAKEGTIANLKNIYGISSVNGSNQVMEAAPEMFYQDDILDTFNEKLEGQIKTLGDTLGWSINTDGTFNSEQGKKKLEIRPVPGVTLGQPLYNKTYMIYDAVSGHPVTNDSGAFAYFEFNLNDTKYKDEIDSMISSYEERREQNSMRARGALSNIKSKRDQALSKIPQGQLLNNLRAGGGI